MSSTGVRSAGPLPDTSQRMAASSAKPDLAGYQVRIREPLEVDYRDRRIAMIAINSGGPTVAEMFNILEGFDLAASGHNTVPTLHLIAEAQRLAFADRFAFFGAIRPLPPFPWKGCNPKPTPPFAAARSTRPAVFVSEPVGDPRPFQPGGKPASLPSANGGDAAGQHTTHLTVIDRERNMVSLTASLGQLFGSGVVAPGTGVTLNNGMMWFDPEPGHVNSIGPGKRALHAGTPALVFDEHGPFLAVGSPGGRKVLTAVQQIIHNVVDFGLRHAGRYQRPADSLRGRAGSHGCPPAHCGHRSDAADEP